MYASLMFAYSRSKVLLSLVWHFTYWVKVGRAEDREAWLKSPEDEEEGLGVLVLKRRDDSVDLVRSCSSNRRGGDLHSHGNNVRTPSGGSMAAC